MIDAGVIEQSRISEKESLIKERDKAYTELMLRVCDSTINDIESQLKDQQKSCSSFSAGSYCKEKREASFLAKASSSKGFCTKVEVFELGITQYYFIYVTESSEIMAATISELKKRLNILYLWKVFH